MSDVPVFCGVKLLVQFYANNGQLGKVSDNTGVPVDRIKAWLETGSISDDDFDSLQAPLRKKEAKNGI